MLYQNTCNTFFMKLPKWIQEFLFSSNILVQDYNFKMFKNRFAYPNISNMQGKGKSGEIHFLGVGVLKIQSMMANIFTLLFKHLTNVCLFVFTQLGLDFCEALNEINEIFWKKIISISPKKRRKFTFCCFVLFLFCILRSRFSFITYEITARFLLILILEVKLHNCFFFSPGFHLYLWPFQDFFGPFQGLQGPFQGLVKWEIVNTPGRVKNYKQFLP